MIRYIVGIYIGILVLFCGSTVKAQNITFNHLTTEDGLSQFSVNALYVDENGQLWIGTREGLNRYNGSDIQTFKFHKNDPYSLFSNSVLRITGNRAGKVYLLCTEGVAEFDLATQRFKTMLQDKVKTIYYLDRLFIAIKNEIYWYDEDTGNFNLFAKVPGDTEITAILYDGNRFLVGTNSMGVYALDAENHEFTHFIKKGNITQIYMDSQKCVWIGSWEDGLFCISENDEIQNFRTSTSVEHCISSNFVRAICEDNLGYLWVGTFNGLNRYDKATGEFRYYTVEEGGGVSLTHPSIWCIVKDGQGTLWTGTYFGGVNYFNPEYGNYNYYHYSTIPGKGLSSPIVGRMVEDNQENLWIATEGGGLNYFDRKTGKFKWFKANASGNGISHDNVKSLFFDKEDEVLWVGTHLGGLNRFDPKTNRFKHYRMVAGDESSLPSDIIRDIEPYGKDSLIIATQNGVCAFNKYDGKCRRLFQDTKQGKRIQMVADVEFDRAHRLWIAATGEGLFRYDFRNGELKNYRHQKAVEGTISGNSINNIHLDVEGKLWLATAGSGLDLYLPESDSFKNFDQEKNGLASDCIYNTWDSPLSHRLLLITNLGFSIFDKNTCKFTNYNTKSGLPLTAINENALCVTSDGEIFLGGVKNMVSFNESALARKPKPYRILLDKLIVNGEEIKVGDNTGILSNSLSYTKEIKLRSYQSMFSIEFSVSNYLAVNKRDIMYKLEGFSKQWNNIRNSNSITYTNLNAGDYTLIIQPKDTDAEICAPVKLQIHILPSFWETPQAFLLYILILVGVTLYLVQTYKARVNLRESLRYETKHRQDIEVMNQSKLRFFTNISHEFRTPLTLIITQIEVLLQASSFTPHLYNKILSIYKNSIILRELVTELLDFRKQEQGHMKLKVSQHDIVSFVYENYLLFSEYAAKQHIKLEFLKEEDEIKVWYDAQQMQKVLNNLLSNAIKHTPADGTITIRVFRRQLQVVLEVEDTGKGIPAQELDKIFERFYQIDTSEDTSLRNTGTGIGLAFTKGIVELHHGSIHAESRLGEGSRFVVVLQLGNKHFQESEICQNSEDSMVIETPVPQLFEGENEDAMGESSDVNTKISGAKVVIAEDNDALREVLVGLFAPYYQVFSAADGEEALALVQKEMPNIIVSDVVMPKMSGTTLCKQVKEDFATCHIPVVLLTARTSLEQNIEGLVIGADDYISKPFNTRLLIARCNNLVNSRLILQEKFSKQPQTAPQMLATNVMDKEILDKALSIIESHLDDTEFNINVFSKEMGMARTNLFTKLKAITGQTPNEFILSIRLKKGAWMLRNQPELNIAEISDRIGFSSPRYFSKCFKDMYNINPMAYRKGEAPEAMENQTN